MTIYQAEKQFKAAKAYLRSGDTRGLWHVNEGLIELCRTLGDIETSLADLDAKIVHVSRQVAAK